MAIEYFFAKNVLKNTNIKLKNPEGIVVDYNAANLYIADTENKRVLSIQLDNNTSKDWKIILENDSSEPVKPTDIELDRDKIVVLANYNGFGVYSLQGDKICVRNRYIESDSIGMVNSKVFVAGKVIYEFGPDIAYGMILEYNNNTAEGPLNSFGLIKVGTNGINSCGWTWPYGIIYDNHEFIICAGDENGNSIQRYSEDGEWKAPEKKIINTGKLAKGTGYIPVKDMFIFLADSIGKGILVFKYNGNNLEQVSIIRWIGFKKPIDMTVDKTGMVYVLDNELNQVINFAPRALQLDGRKGISKKQNEISIPLLLRKTKGISKISFMIQFNPNYLEYKSIAKGNGIKNDPSWKLTVDNNNSPKGYIHIKLETSPSKELSDYDFVQIMDVGFIKKPITQKNIILINISNPDVYNKNGMKMACAGIDIQIK